MDTITTSNGYSRPTVTNKTQAKVIAKEYIADILGCDSVPCMKLEDNIYGDDYTEEEKVLIREQLFKLETRILKLIGHED